MLIALFIVLLLTGGSSDGSPTFMSFIADSRDSVESVVFGDSKKKEALAVLSKMDDKTKELNKQVKKSFKELDSLIKDRSDTTAEIIVLLDQHTDNIEAYGNDILDLRFELKDHITREEWAQIFGE